MTISHFNQSTTEVISSQRDLGKSSTTTLSTMFAQSPIHAGQYTPDVVKQKGQSLLLDGDVPAASGYYSLPGFSRSFNDNNPPSPGEVLVGGGGLPGSPYGPNPNSPNKPGSLDPTDIPEPPSEDFPPLSSGGGSTAFPSNSSEAIASQTLGTFISGKSYGGSNSP